MNFCKQGKVPCKKLFNVSEKYNSHRMQFKCGGKGNKVAIRMMRRVPCWSQLLAGLEVWSPYTLALCPWRNIFPKTTVVLMNPPTLPQLILWFSPLPPSPRHFFDICMFWEKKCDFWWHSSNIKWDDVYIIRGGFWFKPGTGNNDSLTPVHHRETRRLYQMHLPSPSPPPRVRISKVVTLGLRLEKDKAARQGICDSGLPVDP